MKIEILCQSDEHCNLMRAKVYQALNDLNMHAEVRLLRSADGIPGLRYANLQALLIDGRLAAVGYEQSVEDIRKLIDIGTGRYH